MLMQGMTFCLSRSCLFFNGIFVDLLSRRGRFNINIGSRFSRFNIIRSTIVDFLLGVGQGNRG